jgi:hypothetical protein
LTASTITAPQTLPFVPNLRPETAQRGATLEPDEFADAWRAAFKAAGFKHYSRTYYLQTIELIWVVKPERIFRGLTWAIHLGCHIRALDPESQRPRQHECHVQLDYKQFGDAVPDAATGSRFDDHSSYFSSAFDLSYLKITDAARMEAISFAARDMSEQMITVDTVARLAKFISDYQIRGFISRQARELLPAAPSK